MNMKYFGRLEVISFVIGASLMTFELAAARVLAPTIGSSTYVWTSVIGVIIAALSLGYYTGGVIADKRNKQSDVALLLVAASFFVMFALVTYDDVLGAIAEGPGDVRVQGLLASLILFAPASFVLGAISPYLAKLRVRSLETSGRSVASLSAYNSLGGIVGTFVTGFILFGYIGSKETIMIVGAVLFLSSWLVDYRSRVAPRVAIGIVMVFMGMSKVSLGSDVISIDTMSAHYVIQTTTHSGQQIRGLQTGPRGIQSGVRLDGSSEPVFWYTKELARITLEKQPSSILILGGGAFTLPEYLGEKLPDAHIDVVEIDPKLKTIAEDYFYFTKPRNVELIFADARSFINQTDRRYDVIIVDVYGDTSIPFTFLTREYGEQVSARLNDKGIVLANILAGVTGPCRAIFDAANTSYGATLPKQFYTSYGGDTALQTSMITLYSTHDAAYGLKPVPKPFTPSYSDNFMPAERLSHGCNNF
jgi:predicted membrane-bound spermidine synthase